MSMFHDGRAFKPRWYRIDLYWALGRRLGAGLWLDDHIVRCRVQRLCDWVDEEALK